MFWLYNALSWYNVLYCVMTPSLPALITPEQQLTFIQSLLISVLYRLQTAMTTSWTLSYTQCTLGHCAYIHTAGKSGPNPIFILCCSRNLFNVIHIWHLSEQFMLCKWHAGTEEHWFTLSFTLVLVRISSARKEFRLTAGPIKGNSLHIAGKRTHYSSTVVSTFSRFIRNTVHLRCKTFNII